MKLKLLAAIAALGLTMVGAQAASGIFGTYINVGGTWYGADETDPDTLTAFQGANLGTFNIGDTLTIGDAEILTFKNGLSNVTGGEINWRVWSGVEGGAFAPVAIGFSSDATFTAADGQQFTNGGDQQWGALASTPNVLASLGAGSYTLEVYFRASTSDGDAFSSNGGNNFEATFTVVPEPSTLMLGAVGLVGLVVARRRLAK